MNFSSGQRKLISFREIKMFLQKSVLRKFSPNSKVYFLRKFSPDSKVYIEIFVLFSYKYITEELDKCVVKYNCIIPIFCSKSIFGGILKSKTKIEELYLFFCKWLIY